MKHLGKRWAAAGCAALVLFLGGCAKAEAPQLDQFLEEEFVAAMEGDYITAHVYLENPEDFGVDLSQTPVTLGARFTDDGQEAYEALEERYETFQTIRRDTLSPQEQDDYDVYQFTTQLALALVFNHVVIGIFLAALWGHMLTDNPYWAVAGARVVQAAVMASYCTSVSRPSRWFASAAAILVYASPLMNAG